MRLTIERGSDPILKSSYYSLKIGTRVYHYEKLADILYRVAVLFEPPPEEVKPSGMKSRITGKPASSRKPKKFPLGDEIVRVLSSAKGGWHSLDDIRKQIKTPKPISKSVWSMVLANLQKKKRIKVARQNEEDRYGI